MEELKQQLINIINQSKLPAEAIYFVVKDFYRDVFDEYQTVKQQLNTKDKEEKTDGN